jgi:hypothetical protein
MDDKNFEWFRFDPKRVYFDILNMPDHIAGRYIKLLCEEWFNGTISSSLPSMPETIEVKGELLGIDGTQLKGGSRGVQQILIRLDKQSIWDLLKFKFEMNGGGNYVSPWLEDERQDTAQRIKSQHDAVENGRKGGIRSGMMRKLKSVSQATLPLTHPSTPGSTMGSSPPRSDVQPITVHNINNLNYPQGDFEKNGEEEIHKRLQDLIHKHGEAMMMAGDLKNRPAQFVQFVFEYWIRDTIAKGIDQPINRLRENFVDFVNNRMGEVEKAFSKVHQTKEWFLEELQNSITDDMDISLIRKFKEYYLKQLPSGGYHFQTFPNFSMKKTLIEWIANERPARGKRESREPVHNVQPQGTPQPIPYYNPSEEEKKRYDIDIKKALNRHFERYRNSGDARILTTAEYRFMREFGLDLPPEEEIETTYKKKIYEERKAMVEQKTEGKDDAGTRRLYDLKRQYATNKLDNEENSRIHRESYLRAMTKFFDKLIKDGAEVLFEI